MLIFDSPWRKEVKEIDLGKGRNLTFPEGIPRRGSQILSLSQNPLSWQAVLPLYHLLGTEKQYTCKWSIFIMFLWFNTISREGGDKAENEINLTVEILICFWWLLTTVFYHKKQSLRGERRKKKHWKGTLSKEKEIVLPQNMWAEVGSCTRQWAIELFFSGDSNNRPWGKSVNRGDSSPRGVAFRGQLCPTSSPWCLVLTL